MIPNPDQLRAIAQLRQGSLGEVPFAALLHAMAAHKRTAVLEIERGPLKKEIVLEEGVPVDCRSNLLHETLGRFMVAQGAMDEDSYQRCLNKSASQGIPFGEAAILEGLTTATDLYRTLQQNLAKKLLDGFTWRSGNFRVLDEVPEVLSPLKVNAAQLVVTGISKFTLDDEVNEAIGPVVGKKLFLNPNPPFPVEDIHLSAQQKELVGILERGKRIDELAAETTIPFDQIMRLLYSLAVIGLIMPAEWLPKEPMPRPAVAAASQPETGAFTPVAAPVVDVARIRDELLEKYLRFRKEDAYDLLSVPESGTLEVFQDKFLRFSRKFAPWHFEAPGLSSLREKAEDLFLAGGMAFGELCDVDRRNALLNRRQILRDERLKKPDPSRFAIKSQLLDSELQFKKGKALMQEQKYREALQQLQFAYDCDPQNSDYRAELAYCRFLDEPARQSGHALSELREAMRIDPKCGLAIFYTGDILRRLDRFDEAEQYLQRSIKMLMPDRRPIESLKALQIAQKKKRKGFLGKITSSS